MVRKAQTYPPSSLWRRAEKQFSDLPLKSGEVTKIVDHRTGQAYHLVAKKGREILQTSYMDGVKMPSEFVEVSSLELSKR